MKTFKLLAALSVAALAAGCQHSERSASMSPDQSDNEVSLRATSTDPNVVADSDGKTAQLRRTGREDDRATTAVHHDNPATGTAASGDASATANAESKPADNTGRNVR